MHAFPCLETCENLSEVVARWVEEGHVQGTSRDRTQIVCGETESGDGNGTFVAQAAAEYGAIVGA